MAAEPTEPSVPLPLPYGSSGRRRWRRRSALIIVLLSSFVALTRLWRPILLKFSVLYQQSQALDHSPDTHLLVYAEVYPDDFKALMGQFPSLRVLDADGIFCRAGRRFAPWDRLRNLLPARVGVTPEATIFAGGLTSTGGKSRLVIVEISRSYGRVPDLYYFKGDPPMALEINVIQPETLLASANLFRHFVSFQDGDFQVLDWGLLLKGHAGLRIFPGFVDPQKPSRFVADLQVGPYAGQLVGELKDDEQLEVKVLGLDELLKRIPKY